MAKLVHHIDHNPLNNALENLQLVSGKKEQIALYEVCPTCEGRKLVEVRLDTVESTVTRTCTTCAGTAHPGYMPHDCPRDDTCPCYADGRGKGIETPREPLGV